MSEPPKKKRKLNPNLIEECNDSDSSDVDIFYYGLHVNSDIIIFSNDSNIPITMKCNFDDNNKNPNLFTVNCNDINNYNENKWMLYHKNNNDFIKCNNLLNNTNNDILIITGAGMGCDSGLPDYRSNNGFWKNYKRNIFKNMTLYEMSQSKWFKNNPSKAWGFYEHRKLLYNNCKPHNGFNILKEYCDNNNSNNNNNNNNDSNGREYFYMTSNIDSQCITAGFNEKNVFQTHGCLNYIQCSNYYRCRNNNIIKFDKCIRYDENTFDITNMDDIPKCKYCGNIMRPNVSFFTDSVKTFNSKRVCEQKETFLKWLNKYIKKGINNPKLIVIEIGCGNSIHSLKWESQYLKTFNNITLIRINPNISINDINNKSRHIHLKLKANIALNSIFNAESSPNVSKKTTKKE